MTVSALSLGLPLAFMLVISITCTILRMLSEVSRYGSRSVMVTGTYLQAQVQARVFWIQPHTFSTF